MAARLRHVRINTLALGNHADQSKGERMARKKSDGTEGTETKDRRMQVDLSPELTNEIKTYCDAHPFVNRSAVNHLIRDTATSAANAATIGRVEEIVKAAL